ncbi:MAG: hypothetical protein U1F68_00420 [Gammaproteobacteria bacterium]
MRIIDQTHGSAVPANETTPLLPNARTSASLQHGFRALQTVPPPSLPAVHGAVSHLSQTIPAQPFAAQIANGKARLRPSVAAQIFARKLEQRSQPAAQAAVGERIATRVKAWLMIGKHGAIHEGLAKEGSKLTTVDTELAAIHAACKANEGAIGSLIGASGALGLVTEAVKTAKTQAEIRSGRELIATHQAAERDYGRTVKTYDAVKAEYELALTANKRASAGNQPPQYGTGFLDHLRARLEMAEQHRSAAHERLLALDASNQLGKQYTAKTTERQAVHGVGIGASASTVVAGALKGIAPAIDVAAKGLNAAGAGFIGAAALASVPLSARALAKDVSDYRKNSEFDAAVKRQIETLSGPDGDPGLTAIAKLVHNRTETKGKVVSAVKNALGITSGLAAGVASSAAIAAAAGAGAAAAVATIATPVGWALAGATAAVAIGYGLWKLGKYLYNQHQLQKLEGLASGEGKHFDQELAVRAQRRGIDLGTPNARPLLAPQQAREVMEIKRAIKNEALLEPSGRDPLFAAQQLLERLRLEGNGGITERFLRTLNFGDDDLRALLRSSKAEDAQTLLMKKLNLA